MHFHQDTGGYRPQPSAARVILLSGLTSLTVSSLVLGAGLSGFRDITAPPDARQQSENYARLASAEPSLISAIERVQPAAR